MPSEIADALWRTASDVRRAPRCRCAIAYIEGYVTSKNWPRAMRLVQDPDAQSAKVRRWLLVSSKS